MTKDTPTPGDVRKSEFGMWLESVCSVCHARFKIQTWRTTVEGAYTHNSEIEQWENNHKAHHIIEGKWI